MSSTPARDRDRLPFPQSVHPSPVPSARHTSSASASQLSSSPANSSPQTITVEALLQQHATAQDPKKAALEQVVNDRNVLSSQNTQLWKLIEKQRAGYNQILKELERIRGERDGYKAKLAALGAIPNGEKRQKLTSERLPRPSLDASTSHPSVPQTPQGRPAWRQNSDDQVIKSSHQGLNSSRSFDPIVVRNTEPALQSNANYSASAPRPSTPPQSHSGAPANLSTPRNPRPVPVPLVVPLPDDGSPQPQPISNSPNISPFSKPQLVDSASTPGNTGTNGMTYNPNVRPLNYTRKTAEPQSGLAPNTSSTSASSLPSSLLPPHSGDLPSSTSLSSSHRDYSVPPSASSGLNPAFADDSTHPRHWTASAFGPSTSSGPPSAAALSASTPPTSAHHSSAHSQSSLLDVRPHMLSRDSRITLPDEARQYIVNMADSPLPSPRNDNFNPKSKLSESVYPPRPTPNGDSGQESEFLDMDDEEETDEDEEAAGVKTAVGESIPPPQSQFPPSNDQGPYRSLPHSQSDAQPPLSYHSTDDLDPSRRKDKSRVVPEEFPLPPNASTNPYIQRQPGSVPQDHPSHSQSQLQQLQGPPPMQQPPSVSAPSPSKHGQATTDPQPSSSPTPSAPQPAHDPSSNMTDPPYPPNQGNPPPSRQDSRAPEPERPTAVPASFRALPLLSSDLPHTTIAVSHSFVRPNDRGKEVLSFIVSVNPGHGKEGWKVEKMYSDVLSLDQRVRSSIGKGLGKKIANLPEGKLWKDHAPAKVDQRKAVLENYLQSLIQLPIKSNDEVIAFFTSDIVREQNQPVMQVGHKEGYLTKRGKNFGGWKTRFFVLQGPVLEYYDCRGGAHLGSITITGAQIARQHRTEKPPTNDDEKEYRHAFLIVEAKKAPGGSHPRHVLCAESDEDRDSWVEMLVRYYTGTYTEDLVFNPTSGLTSVQGSSLGSAASQQPPNAIGQPRSSTSSTEPSSSSSRARNGAAISKGNAVPISQLPPDASNAKLFQSVPTSDDYLRSSSPSRSIDPSPVDRHGPSAATGPLPRSGDRSNLGPGSSLAESVQGSSQPFQPETSSLRANSQLGYYADSQEAQYSRSQPTSQQQQQQQAPPRQQVSDHRLAPQETRLPERAASPEKADGKPKISGPKNGVPIPPGFKFPGKEGSDAASDRREKAKSRSFWRFGGDKSTNQPLYAPRAVFGVPLEESLEVAQLCNLPAIVFRCIQYLEAKEAELEEGIYRLSGSSAVIKGLKDRFNNEGDVDLLASDEYWDPHAISGLLKTFLRELPSSILTRELHLRFLAVIDFVDPQERIWELSHLIGSLPIANYSLLRALTAHLILIVQNSNINKMTMRNVGIVFSPTLGIPAGVFSLMLGEFNRVFNVDTDGAEARPQGDASGLLENPADSLRRNSRQYTDGAADQALGLTGRSLKASTDEAQSDGDDYSIQDESGTETTEGEVTVESSSSQSPVSAMTPQEHTFRITPPEGPGTPMGKGGSKASNVAASRGLNVTVTHSERGNRHSRMMGLPTSPRPMTHSPSRDGSSTSSPTVGREQD